MMGAGQVCEEGEVGFRVEGGSGDYIKGLGLWVLDFCLQLEN